MNSSSVHKYIHLSVIVPVKNEERYIEKCLCSLINQTLDKKCYEIIVVDGLSTDKTREIAEKILSQSGVRYRILVNEKISPASGINMGVKVAGGRYIARCDAHTIYSPDFLEQAIRVLEEKNADFAGGHQIPSPTTFIEKVITIFMMSPSGAGGARFRKPEEEGWSDTAYMGVYRKEVFEKLGGFDETLYGSEDDTFHWKMLRHGYKIYLSPRIKSKYIPAGNLRDQIKRFFRYGFAKGRATLKYRRLKPFRQFIPPLFTIYAASLPAIIPLMPPPLIAVYLIPACIYLLLLMGTSFRWMGRFFLPSLAVPLIFPLLHLAYGLGFVMGFFKELPTVPRNMR